jgi:hypothetical protein
MSQFAKLLPSRVSGSRFTRSVAHSAITLLSHSRRKTLSSEGLLALSADRSATGEDSYPTATSRWQTGSASLCLTPIDFLLYGSESFGGVTELSCSTQS